MKKDFLSNKDELAQEGQQKSAYDEIMDGILWVAKQEGKYEKAKKVYDRIKRRNAAEEKRMREYLPKNPNEYNLDGKRYIEKIKKCSCEEIKNGRYMLWCNIHQRGSYYYEYIPGELYIYTWGNEKRRLYLSKDAIDTVEKAVEGYEQELRDIEKWNAVTVHYEDKNVLIRYHQVCGDKFEYYLDHSTEQNRNEKIYRLADSLHYLLYDIADILTEGKSCKPYELSEKVAQSTKKTIEENPVYKGAKNQGDDLFMNLLKLHFGITSREENIALEKVFGKRILPNLSKSFDKVYIIDSKTLDYSLLDRSGYRMIHCPTFSMAGKTHEKISVNPHAKSAVDAAKVDELAISFSEFLKLFDNEENIK